VFLLKLGFEKTLKKLVAVFKIGFLCRNIAQKNKMTNQEIEAHIEAEVAKRVEKIMAEQQKQFSKTLATLMKNAVGGVDKANTALKKEQKKLEKALDAAKKLHDKAKREGEKMATEAYEAHRITYETAAWTDLRRELTRMHIEVGKTNREIAVWLDVPQDFVENIRQIMKRVDEFHPDKPKRTHIEGNPKIRVTDSGRSGAVHFDSRETSFELWWEMGFGKALFVVDVPTVEKWEKVTQLPLEKRIPVLHFIGEQLVLQETHDEGSFLLGEHALTVYGDK
jgi:hypothetical protein